MSFLLKVHAEVRCWANCSYKLKIFFWRKKADWRSKTENKKLIKVVQGERGERGGEGVPPTHLPYLIENPANSRSNPRHRHGYHNENDSADFERNWMKYANSQSARRIPRHSLRRPHCWRISKTILHAS